MFSFELYEILQNSFLKEHVWTAASDLGKYLKTLAIICKNIFQVFAKYISSLASEAIWKPYLKHDTVWEKFFPEKYIVATIYVYISSLGWKWGLVPLNIPILS